MNEYTIITDSACDIKPELLAKWGVKYVSLTFAFEGSDKEYRNGELASEVFYKKMRDGAIAKTSAANADTFKNAFAEEVKNGKDVLYLGFSSGLSTTYNSSRLAAAELSELYPERKIICVDTLAASAGFGLLLYLALQRKAKGDSIEEVEKFVMDSRLRICQWFTVDDLIYLKRGGRISAATAFVGGVLGIKPVLHVDNEGHLISALKARGRKASLKALADKYGVLAVNPEHGTVFISHGDCLEDVNTLKDMLKTTYGADVKLVTDVGPVIGAHSGPGTVALFFVGKER
ncbi:MAG: DegV family protein [Ruminococcus sp.]|nr:DegV family protein [Ruminococcus sp.]